MAQNKNNTGIVFRLAGADFAGVNFACVNFACVDFACVDFVFLLARICNPCRLTTPPTAIVIFFKKIPRTLCENFLKIHTFDTKFIQLFNLYDLSIHFPVKGIQIFVMRIQNNYISLHG
jgi:hypothetical protein